MELQCKVQNYEWGKLGKDSLVAKLLASADSSAAIEDNTPYAEYWMGTHPNGPAVIPERGILLSEYISKNLDALGPDVVKKFGVTVPFLLKILSVRKALSIQAHPEKEHAEMLHKTNPAIYKDPNHKPELAIALTPFEALCGFRESTEIKMFLLALPELVRLLSPKAVEVLLSIETCLCDAEATAIKDVFTSLITCDKDLVSKSLLELLARLEKEDEATQALLMYPLLRRVHNDYPGDVGCWAPYFIHYIQLKPGEAIFLKPNIPHAYLSGDCLECMSCSDNVVRLGLTSKMVDVDTLVSMLDYRSQAADRLLLTPTLEDANSCVWRTPYPDFAVVKVKVQSGEVYNTKIRNGPSILIVTEGSGSGCDTEPVRLQPGRVLFLKASRQLTLTADSNTDLVVYQATSNLDHTS